ncbi:MAG: CtkA family protein [Lachnospiraceae bacterium]|nr:CtkA family protein [Lachnospiraceae bacterium]
MIDFSKCEHKNKTYSGANGSKISVVYDNGLYMLKFPSRAPRNDDISYSNSCFSEYLGCKIFKEIGIPVQDVVLGTYTTNKGNEKIVVACKDFAVNGKVLQDFGSLKNQIVDSENNGYGTELEDIKETFELQTIVDPIELSKRFWDMFIVDALIGNWDRHNGNWGFLYDSMADKNELAPVFDCGSSLYPQLDEEKMKHILVDGKEIKARVYNIPTSAIRINSKRINYYNFILSGEEMGCNDALKRIVPNIDTDKIFDIIDNMPIIGDVHKDFYKQMLIQRYNLILVKSYKNLNKLYNIKKPKRL